MIERWTSCINYHNSLPAKRAYHSDNSDSAVRLLVNKSILAWRWYKRRWKKKRKKKWKTKIANNDWQWSSAPTFPRFICNNDDNLASSGRQSDDGNPAYASSPQHSRGAPPPATRCAHHRSRCATARYHILFPEDSCSKLRAAAAGHIPGQGWTEEGAELHARWRELCLACLVGWLLGASMHRSTLFLSLLILVHNALKLVDAHRESKSGERSSEIHADLRGYGGSIRSDRLDVIVTSIRSGKEETCGYWKK